MISMRLRLWLPVLCSVLFATAASCALASELGAQVIPPKSDTVRRDSAAVPADSMAARLARAEAAIALLQQQLAIEAATAVRTRSRLQLELSGRVLANSYFTQGRTNSVELPLFVRETATPSNAAQGQPGTRAFGISLRQTLLGAAISVDSVLGATFVGDIDIDFFSGGTSVTADAFGFPTPRLRTVTAQLRWAKTSLLVGTESPLISDLNPVSLAAAGTPEFAVAGNLWNWIPQVRASHTVLQSHVGTTPVSWTVHAAALAPVSGVRHPNEPDAIDAGERSGRPALEGRVSMQWGAANAADEARGEIGFGVHRGWLRVNGDTLIVARAVAATAQVGLTHGLTLLAEGYSGRAISSLGGGGIAQTFGTALPGEVFGPPVRDIAGWAQLNAQLRPTLSSGVGCGLDVADARDRPRRLRNAACEAHLIWRPTQPVLVGVEFRRLKTVYANGSQRASHVNLALGFEW